MDLNRPPVTETHWPTSGDDPKELIVTCVFWGKKYTVDYVHKLKSMVDRNLTIPHRFVCLSDVEIEGIECIPVFAATWQGWWQKVALFTPKLFPSDARILYFDLDVVITNNIDDMARMTTEQPIIMIFNYGPNRHHAAHNSSVMLWTAGDSRLDDIHDLFTTDVMKSLHGDQCWIWRVLQDKVADWPQALVPSYKYHCRVREMPKGAKVIVFHGDPKPHQCKEPWVLRNWC